MSSLQEALEMTGATDAGRVREHNEDALLYDAGLGIVILADGMGGYQAGEVASGLTVDVVNETLHLELAPLPTHAKSGGFHVQDGAALLRVAIEQANATVFERASRDPQCAGMGTTVVCALFFDNRVFAAHVGDSRLYRYRAAEFTQLTRDHSLLQEQMDAGLLTAEEARHATYRNLVTRAVGIESQVEVETHEFDAQPGDIYLFCSDGLSDMVDDTLMGDIVSLFSDNLPLAAQALIEQANANGGKDNISVALVGVRCDFAMGGSWFSRLSARFR